MTLHVLSPPCSVLPGWPRQPAPPLVSDPAGMAAPHRPSASAECGRRQVRLGWPLPLRSMLPMPSHMAGFGWSVSLPESAIGNYARNDQSGHFESPI
jgi:hypothetical protein